MNFRIGFGYDVHRLEKGLELIIGGVKVHSDKGAVGHSDADVLIHAICDALLGAANLGDLGKHFPDTDPKYCNINSGILLKEVVKLLEENKFSIGNIDSTICLQEPKIAPLVANMKIKLSKLMQIPKTNISIKATTTEKLSFVGEGKGISAYAVVLIEKSN